MNVEQLDGFLVALICCPSDIPKTEYLPEIRIGANSDFRLILIYIKRKSAPGL
jgi:hypothetical protein